MQSMIKREVSLSLTAHSELIRQIILDGLEVTKHRSESFSEKGGFRLRSDAIYYRNMRMTGHSTALRTIYTAEEFKDITVISVFLNSTHRDDATSKLSNKNKASSLFLTEPEIINVPDCLRGKKIDVLVLNDYISSDRIGNGWNLIDQILPKYPHLKLVVFLG